MAESGEDYLPKDGWLSMLTILLCRIVPQWQRSPSLQIIGQPHLGQRTSMTLRFLFIVSPRARGMILAESAAPVVVREQSIPHFAKRELVRERSCYKVLCTSMSEWPVHDSYLRPLVGW